MGGSSVPHAASPPRRLAARGHTLLTMSAATGAGTAPVLEALWKLLQIRSP